jgi:hypothetical protein
MPAKGVLNFTAAEKQSVMNTAITGSCPVSAKDVRL